MKAFPKIAIRLKKGIIKFKLSYWLSKKLQKKLKESKQLLGRRERRGR